MPPAKQTPYRPFSEAVFGQKGHIVAKLRLSALLGAISGSLGGGIFKNAKSGTVVAHRPAKINQRTPPQLDSRKAYALCVHDWRLSSPEFRLAWARLALTFPLANALGVLRPRSGFHLYLKLNIPWAYIHNGTLDTIPSPTTNTPPYNITTDYVFDDVFDVTYWVDPQTGPARPVISFGRTFSTSRPKFFHNYRFIKEGENEIGPNADTLQPPLESIVGKPQVGEWVFTRFVSISSTSFPSFPVDVATQVT